MLLFLFLFLLLYRYKYTVYLNITYSCKIQYFLIQLILVVCIIIKYVEYLEINTIIFKVYILTVNI